MLQDIVKKGSTDRSVTLRIIDSTDGTPETGVEHNTSGIDLWYRREGTAKTSITEAALAALTTAHTDGGIEHIGDGEYRLDLPDAAFATGANYVDFGGAVTGMIVIGGRVRLVDVDLEDTVRAGLTALPNAAADAAGGLPISDAGGLDLDARLDVAVSSRLAPTTASRTLDVTAGGCAGIDWANVESPTTTMGLTGTSVKLADGVTHGGTTAMMRLGSSSSTPALYVTNSHADIDSHAVYFYQSNAAGGMGLLCDGGGAQTGMFAPGTEGFAAGGRSLESISSQITTVDNVVDAILLDTGTDGVVVASGSKTGYSLAAGTGLGNQTSDITGSLSGSVGSVTGAVGSVTGNVGGNVTGTVGGIAGTITTLDALDAAQDIQHSTTQAAVAATQASVNTIDGIVDAILLDTAELQSEWANGGRLDLILDTAAAGGGLDAAGIRAALGLSSANLDTQLAAQQADLATITDTGVTCVALAAQAKEDVNAELLDVLATDTLIDGRTIQSTLRIVAAIVAGKVSGGGTNNEVFVGLDGSTTRATVTADANGDRTAVIYV